MFQVRDVEEGSHESRDEKEEFRRQNPKDWVTDWMMMVIMESNIKLPVWLGE